MICSVATRTNTPSASGSNGYGWHTTKVTRSTDMIRATSGERPIITDTGGTMDHEANWAAEIAAQRERIVALEAERDEARREADNLNDSCQSWIESESRWRKLAEQAVTDNTILMSEVEAARALAATLEAGIARDGYCPICGQTERVTLQTGYYTHHDGCTLAAYEAARKGGADDPLD